MLIVAIGLLTLAVVVDLPRWTAPRSQLPWFCCCAAAVLMGVVGARAVVGTARL